MNVNKLLIVVLETSNSYLLFSSKSYCQPIEIWNLIFLLEKLKEGISPYGDWGWSSKGLAVSSWKDSKQLFILYSQTHNELYWLLETNETVRSFSV